MVGASVASTAAHYTDNALFIEDYPQPDWLSTETIFITWGLLTLLGIAGYLFYRAGQTTTAGLYLLLYSNTGVSSLGHYFYGFDDFSLKMNVLIWTDGMTGLAVAAFAVWILAKRPSPSDQADASAA